MAHADALEYEYMLGNRDGINYGWNGDDRRASFGYPPNGGTQYIPPIDSRFNSPPGFAVNHHAATQLPLRLSPPLSNNSRSTLWWGELEPWMDEEYAKQVCALMGWDPLAIKVPHPPPDGSGIQPSNNPGYCFVTFPSPAHAAAALSQVNAGQHISMPNSAKPFVLNWASSMPATPPAAVSYPSPQPQAPYPREYSIFVGDLAPETSNSDLVAVFRNPVLGLRNDREPKFIRPFFSCKSAKIMLDPVTGVSRGYGFVRFTDEADQQRALIEMHGLYCLSRPMRISPATAKFKPPPIQSLDSPHLYPGLDQQSTTVAVLIAPQAKSVSAPIAATNVAASLKANGIPTSGSGGSSISSGTASSASLSAGSGALGSSAPPSSEELASHIPNDVLAQIAQHYNSGDVNAAAAVLKQATASIVLQSQSNSSNGSHQDAIRQATPIDGNGQYRYGMSNIPEESWKHHAQARAILGNLIGPNGEQLTSTDPYNTTVFVGGLSPLISEDTLRTFFAPFGDIHYVKVPVGKHCGFVQFVRKADAERAIEKMQGFPVGGSRIRLSWGRSQYKAAQAAAQAAQAAALQSQYQAMLQPNQQIPGASGMTEEQAIQLLQKFSMQGWFDLSKQSSTESENINPSAPHYHQYSSSEERIRSAVLQRDGNNSPQDAYGSAPTSSEMYGPSSAEPRPQTAQPHGSSFSPFSPDPNLYPGIGGGASNKRRDSRADTPKSAGAPSYAALYPQPLSGNAGVGQTQQKSPVGIAPNAARPNSLSRYGSYLSSTGMNPMQTTQGPQQSQISRPGSQSGHEEALQDLNGTLASLDLDGSKSGLSPEIWKGNDKNMSQATSENLRGSP